MKPDVNLESMRPTLREGSQGGVLSPELVTRSLTVPLAGAGRGSGFRLPPPSLPFCPITSLPPPSPPSSLPLALSLMCGDLVPSWGGGSWSTTQECCGCSC